MMAAMQNLIGQWLTSIKHYQLMCVLLSSPERLPHNPFILLLTGFAYFLIGLFLVDAERSYALVCAQITLELLMLGLITYVGLSLRKSMPRFLQTFSALLGPIGLQGLDEPLEARQLSSGYLAHLVCWPKGMIITKWYFLPIHFPALLC